MLRIYGVPWSRASRCLWMLEELGVDYESVSVTNTRDPGYLSINPNGRVPSFVDGELIVWGLSRSICTSPERFPSELSPQSLSEEAQVLKWSFWAEGELECFFNHTASLADIPTEWLERTLPVLDAALAPAGYLVGGRFTVADINAVNMFNGPVSSGLDLSRHAAVRAWIVTCSGRPAARRVLERIQSALQSPMGNT